MVPVNRDTLTLVVAVICVAGIVFLFREVNRTKQELEHMKDFSDYVSKKFEAQESARILSQTPAITDAKPEEEKVAE